MNNEITSIQFRESLVKAIKRVMIEEDFPFDNISIFVAIGFWFLKDDWNYAKSKGQKKSFNKNIMRVIKELQNKELIHEKPRGVKR